MVMTALVFPGQGSQYAGMGRGLMALSEVAATVEECSRETALPIGSYVLTASDPVLRATERAQPAIFALSVGLARALLNEGVRPVLLAGHSIGHFAALAVSGALRLGEAARLVALRGRLMAAGGRRRAGGMAVVSGLDGPVVTRALADSGLPVWPAAINLPAQVTVSGDRDGLEEARTLFTGLGGRWRRLNVSGAFHCPLLDPEAADFAGEVDSIDIGDPSTPILRNCDGAAMSRAGCIHADLGRHMTAPVHWVAVMEALLDAGVGLVVEAGPGKVLTGLMRRHTRRLTVMSTDHPRSVRRAVQAVATHESREVGR